MPRTPNSVCILVVLCCAGSGRASTTLAATTPVVATDTVDTAPAAMKPHGSALAQGDEPKSQHRFVWNYPRFRSWEWGLSIAATGYFTYSVLQEPRKGPLNWHAKLPGDEATRNAVVAVSADGRANATAVSDNLWHVTQFFPFVDSVVMTLLFDDWNWDVAWQMTLLNWQGVAVAGAINRLTHDLIARDRPLLEGCKKYGPDYADPCDDDGAWAVRSFVSGHATSVYFGAGATCAHHLALELYGHPVADIGICALTLGAATTSGVSRMVADTHWLSDVVIGALVGLGSGFGLAYGLHYATPLQKLEAAGMMLIPVVSGESAELRLVGSL